MAHCRVAARVQKGNFIPLHSLTPDPRHVRSSPVAQRMAPKHGLLQTIRPSTGHTTPWTDECEVTPSQSETPVLTLFFVSRYLPGRYVDSFRSRATPKLGSQPCSPTSPWPTWNTTERCPSFLIVGYALPVRKLRSSDTAT